MVQELSHNRPEFTVTELSGALKRILEDAFGYVRVRGEISGYKRAPSGHVYFNLKDENAVLAAVCWKGTTLRLPFKPEDGVEVVCLGRVTTYAGQSKYQIIVEAMEPAGVGALMALLEKRKAQYAAEGLFDAERKKPIPFIPEVIGVVTSPTGAVIRDILHRISDRFPRHVLLWPVLVQGDKAAEQIAGAVKGFNQLELGGKIPRPDVVIVARGGGSLEDLWPFNEEVVVRAVAASEIPVISAVGHETDITLIDYIADKRAPTPTAAAEMAVPVREELYFGVMELGRQVSVSLLRQLAERQTRVEGLARGLPRPQQLLEYASQKLDILSERLSGSLPRLVGAKQDALRYAASGLRLQPVLKEITNSESQLHSLYYQCSSSVLRSIKSSEDRLAMLSRLLDSYHYKKVLQRGFALVKDREKQVVSSKKQVSPGQMLVLEFHDGEQKVVAEGRVRKVKKSSDGRQEQLF